MKHTPLTEERGTTHGNFADNARISQELKATIHCENAMMSAVQLEAIDMICLKLSRIASGKANHIDTWRDIGGYAHLVMQELEKTPGSTDSKVEHIEIV